MYSIQFLLPFLLASSVATPAQEEKRIEEHAAEVLKEAAALLAGGGRFAFRAEETYDEILDAGIRVQLSNVQEVAVARPNRVAIDVNGDTMNRSAWYDGKTLSLFDKQQNAYSVVDAPLTIDETLDFVVEEYGLVFPLADVLYSDPYEALAGDAVFGAYLGLHQLGGLACHHLAFSNESLDWQIWIDAGEKPLFRKLVITYKDEPSEPQYIATFSNWNLQAEIPESLFRFEPPEGAERMEASALMPLAERAEEKK
jgi:hypothetical protein